MAGPPHQQPLAALGAAGSRGWLGAAQVGVTLPATSGLVLLWPPGLFPCLPSLSSGGSSALASDPCQQKGSCRGSASNSPAMQKAFSCSKCRAVGRQGSLSREYSGIIGKEAIPCNRCLLVLHVAPWTQPTRPGCHSGPFCSSPNQLVAPGILPSLAIPHGMLPACRHAFPRAVPAAQPSAFCSSLSAQFTCLLTQAAFPD